MCRDAYAGFTSPAVAPLVQLETQLWSLELFHGPTLAFKDMAMQLLGRMFDHVLRREGRRVTIVGRNVGRHRVRQPSRRSATAGNSMW